MSYIIFFLSPFLIGTLEYVAAERLIDEPQASLVAHFDRVIAVDKPKNLRIERRGGRIIKDGVLGNALSLGVGEYIAFNVADLISSSQGTLMLWVRPHWGYYSNNTLDLNSHTFVSFQWADKRKGYFVLSEGWWEPAGSPYTYLVGNNQDQAHFKFKFPYVKGSWVHFTCTWKVGRPGYISIYVNGMYLYQHKRFSVSDYPPHGKLYIGCDKGSTTVKKRWADSDFDEVMIFNKALSDEEVLSNFKNQDPKMQHSFAWMNQALSRSARRIKASNGQMLETRAIFDEGIGWMTENGAEETIQRIKRAGFNVYIPCIWHGRGTRYPSRLAPAENNVRFIGEEDPLARLIDIAHKNGIEVHTWFTVALRDREKREFFKAYYDHKTPKRAFDLHRPTFRKFIVELMLDVVKRYDVDGINLDYIRTMGFCKSDFCRNSYKKIYNRDLLADIKKRTSNGALLPHLQEWQDQAVEYVVSQVSTRGKRLRPNLLVSVDGHPTLPSQPPNHEGRREVLWANAGWVDIIFAMDYKQWPDFKGYEIISSNLKNPLKLIVILGNYDMNYKKQPIPRNSDLLIKLVALNRVSFSTGVGIYIYRCLNNEQIEALSQGPFKEPAAPYIP